jgi:hypothetical protein
MVKEWARNQGRQFRLPLTIFALLMVAGCNLNATEEIPTSTPTPDQGAISGRVWQDRCLNYEETNPLPSGCILLNSSLIADGIFGNDEAGLDSVTLTLGHGACPSEGVATTISDVSGLFAFTELLPGDYCVTAHDTTNQEAIWSYPKLSSGVGVGWITVTVNAGEITREINFGRDVIEVLPTPEPTDLPPVQTCTDKAEFVRDVTIPDGTRIDPGATFTKTWRFRNDGTCTWNPNYAVVSVSSFSLLGPKLVTLATSVAPGEAIDISMEMQAPLVDGVYEGFWKLRNERGGLFGIGTDGIGPFWVSIEVGPEPEPEITEWKGEYFDNKDLDGDPVLIRNDEEIDFDWGFGSPDEDVPSNDFSVLWTRELEFKEAIYRFTLEMDDGASLWVDDTLVIDGWEDGAVRTRTVQLQMEKGKHDLQVAYYENDGHAQVSFNWVELSAPSFEGWQGTYWPDKSKDSDWALVRDDGEIDFDWGDGSPHLAIPENVFAVQWKKTVEFEPGLYRLNARADDGIRVYIDDALTIDEWHQSNGSELYSIALNLSGEREITVEYYEQKGEAKVQFSWTFEGPENNPPEAVEDVFRAVADTILQVDSPGILENDQDPDGDTLTALLEESPGHGVLVLAEDGSFQYTPNEGYTGEDRFRYRASDGAATSAIVEARIFVSPGNVIPH